MEVPPVAVAGVSVLNPEIVQDRVTAGRAAVSVTGPAVEKVTV
nr:hypothetical protein [uncultured Arsenicibacter sp.]